MFIRLNQEYRQALFLSPLIALYGFAPIYVFTELDLLAGSVSYSALVFSLLIFWIGNIHLFKTRLSATAKYIISYITILFFQISALFLSPFSSLAESANAYYYYIILSTVASNSIILLLINANKLYHGKLKMEKTLGQLELENSKAQIKSLHQQLQPHFLFNTLSTLKSLIIESPVEAENYTVKLSEFLRYTVGSSSKELVTLQDELNFVKDFLALQEKRFGHSLQYEIELPNEWTQYKIPIFAIQTLVENAIKHNRFTENNPLYINIISEKDKIKVTNNKSPKALKIPSGTGLVNLNKRYQLSLNESIDINETSEKFTVLIALFKV